MRWTPWFRDGSISRRLAAMLLTIGLSGCASAAPSLNLFGAFFPGWLACAVIGLIVGGVSRAAMVATGLSQSLPYQLALNAAIGLIAALLAWILWFGR